MKDPYSPAAFAFSRVLVPESLYEKVLSRVYREERRMSRRNALISSVLACASGLALIPAFRVLLVEVSASGFVQYMSLLFSDGLGVAEYWKEFALSLAESFPAAGATFTLAALFAVLASLRVLVKALEDRRRHPQFAS